MQVAGATLLLFQKTTLLGALAMLPVMANTLLIKMFVLVNDYGPYVMATFIGLSLIAIVWHERFALLTLFWSSQKGEPEHSTRAHWWIRVGVVLTVVAIVVSGTILQRRFPHPRQQPQQAQGK